MKDGEIYWISKPSEGRPGLRIQILASEHNLKGMFIQVIRPNTEISEEIFIRKEYLLKLRGRLARIIDDGIRSG